MNIHHHSAPSGRADSSAFGLDAIADSLDTGQFLGVTSGHPVLAAAFAILESFGWQDTRENFVKALPHLPEQLAVSDLRSILSRLGVSSSESRLGRRSIGDLPPATALATADGRILLVQHSASGQAWLLDPVTGERCTETPAPKTLTLSFHQPRIRPRRSYTAGLIARFRAGWWQIMVAKTASNLAALAIAFGVITVYDAVIPAEAHDTLAWLAVGLAGLLALDMGFRAVRVRKLARIAARMEFLVATTVLQKIVSLPLQRITASPVGAQVARIRQFSQMASSLAGTLAEAVIDLFFALFTLAAIFVIAGPLGFVPAVLMLGFGLLAAVFVPRLRRLETAARQAADTENQLAHDLLKNAAAVRCAGDQRAWFDRLDVASRRQAAAGRRAEMAQSAIDAICAVATPVSGGLTALFGAYLAMQGNFSNGALLGAVMLTWRAMAPVQSVLLLATKWTEIERVGKQLNRLADLPAEHDPKRAHIAYSADGDISLKAVAFRYGGKAAPVLRGVSLRIPRGTLVTVTGTSAAGKTTLLRLVAGLLQPASGVVMINGSNLRQIPVSQLRRLISYVPAVPVLVHGSVAQNLRLALPFATEAQMLDVLRELSLCEAVGKLPEGMHTRLTESVQATLPSGFRQSLAVAQALLRDPQILLLDEPAQSMDRDLEAAMLKALKRRRGRVTTLMVTHRPSHIRQADLELHLSNGLLAPATKQKEKPA